MTNRIPPGPQGHPLFGNIQAFTQDTLQFLLDMRAYGDIARFKFGPFPAYVVNHPEFIHDILVTQASKFYKTSMTKTVTKEVLGTGLFTNDGDSWKRQRKLVQPAFHTRRIANYADVMVGYASQVADHWQQGQRVDVEREMTALTMRIVSKTLFDAEVTGEEDELSQAVTTVLSVIDQRFNQLLPRPAWLPTATNRQMHSATKRLNTIIQGFIDERRRSGQDTGDLLSMLLMAQDEVGGDSMSDKQVRDEAMTLFGAGHETTANALTWAWYLLSQNPEVEQQLHGELDAVLGGRLPTFSDLAQLQYTEMIVKEAMRIFPPAWGVTREAIEDVTVGGYTFKKRSIFIVNIYGVHRDERYFPQAMTFDPERFSPENEKNITKYAYLPFGAGPRVCVGNAFAMMEAKLIIATLAQRFRLSLLPGHPVAPERIFVLRPKHGMAMNVSLRETADAPAFA